MAFDISEKISYLQGLSEGLNISDVSPRGKIVSGILNVLDELAEAVTNLQCELEDFKEYVASIDDDLLELEDNFLSDEEFIEAQCPNCGEEIYYESSWLDDDEEQEGLEIICPNCNEVISINERAFDHQFPFGPDETENSQPREQI